MPVLFVDLLAITARLPGGTGQVFSLVKYTVRKYIPLYWLFPAKGHPLKAGLLGALALGLNAWIAASELPVTPESLQQMPAEAAGLAVMNEADRRDDGYQDLRVQLTMLLRDARGRETPRALRIAQLEVADDGDKMRVVFDSPKAIRGTALLSFSHPHRADDQWLYLPALKRVKKITARNKSGPFLSSEFAFEDLTTQQVEKFSYRYLGTATCPLGDCYHVERVPLDEYSGYSRQEVWVDQQAFRIPQVVYYDRRGDPLKTLVASEFQQYQERFWRAQSMLMSNHQTGKSTELLWQDYQFANGLSAERDFSTNSLQRTR